MEGNHKVSVKFAGREIPKSPYNVAVEGHAGDPTKVTASGPGLNPEGNMVHRPTYFDISTKGPLMECLFIFPHLRSPVFLNLLTGRSDGKVCRALGKELEGNR